MGKKDQITRQQISAGVGGSGGNINTKFTTPMLGLEDVYFTLGAAKDAAKVEDTVN